MKKITEKEADFIAEQLIKEALDMGNRNNITKAGDTIGVQKQMIAGEIMGSAAWPFDMPSNPMVTKSNELYKNDFTPHKMESVVEDFVDKILEDSPSYIYTDKDSIGYLVNALENIGYEEFAEELNNICENPEEDSPSKILFMISELKKEKESNLVNLVVEQLAQLGASIAMVLEAEENKEETEEEK